MQPVWHRVFSPYPTIDTNVTIRDILSWALAAVLAIAGVMVLYRQFPLRARLQGSPAAASEQLNARELRFADGAPQLNFIKVESVESLPEPLLDPLSARIAYDENHTSRINSPIAGRVTRIFVEPGDRVAPGQALILVDSPEFAAAAADVAKSRADLQFKQRSYARANESYEAGVIPRRDFESAEMDLRQSEAENNRSKLRLRNLDAAANETGVAGFALRARISGIVSERNVSPGAEIRPDAPNPLFVVTDPFHLWVIVDLPERSLCALRVGDAVYIVAIAYAVSAIRGRSRGHRRRRRAGVGSSDAGRMSRDYISGACFSRAHNARHRA